MDSGFGTEHLGLGRMGPKTSGSAAPVADRLHQPTPSGVPRYASITAGSLRTCAGGPAAMVRP
jgi:hypothetical protein